MAIVATVVMTSRYGEPDSSKRQQLLPLLAKLPLNTLPPDSEKSKKYHSVFNRIEIGYFLYIFKLSASTWSIIHLFPRTKRVHPILQHGS